MKLEVRLQAIGVLAWREELLVGECFHTALSTAADALVADMLLAAPVPGVHVQPAQSRYVYLQITIQRPLSPTEADQLVETLQAAVVAAELAGVRTPWLGPSLR